MANNVARIFNILTNEKLILLASFLLFFLLLVKNPFSERSLSANLEPFPDTFHYLVPATNLVAGRPFGIDRGFGLTKPSVPPLYSLALIPLYVVSVDVRMFFVTNFLLSLIAFGIFYLILKKVTSNKWIIGTALLLYVTNYYLYWYPQWAMAENLLLTLFMLSVYIFTLKSTYTSITAAILVGIGMYMTKFAAAPISMAFLVSFFFKIITRKPQIYYALYYVFFLLFAGVPVLILLYKYNGINHFKSFTDIITNVFLGLFTKRDALSSGATEWVSTYHLVNNFPKYFTATLGRPERLLWDFTPIFARYIAFSGYLGLLLGVIYKKTRQVTLYLLTALFVQMAFVSTFYAVDMRYLITVIPTLIVGIGLFFTVTLSKLKNKIHKNLLVCTIFIFGTFYFGSNAIRLKSQIMLNLKYAEVPWYYKSVLILNEYFSESFEPGRRPVVISPVIPFLIDYYSNGNYDLLPLSPEQEFRTNRELIWGPGDYSNLHNLYRDYLTNGRKLYVSTYGLGNENYLHQAFDDLNKDFKLTEVYNSCFTQCKIYRLESKDL